MLVDMRNDQTIEIKNYRLLAPHVAMVCYGKAKDLLSSNSFGNFLVSAIVTSLGRISIVKLNKAAEAAGYFNAAGDTDSSLNFPIVPNAPHPSTFCDINKRLGGLKIEKDNVRTYCGPQAKTYMTADTEGVVESKCKGFNNLGTLLEASNKKRIIEDILLDSLHPFLLQVCPDNEEATLAGNQPLPSVKIFQRQINIDPRSLVPDVRERPKFAKKLRMIGPRRIIDGYHWLKFVQEEGPKVSRLKDIGRPQRPSLGGNGCSSPLPVEEASDKDEDESMEDLEAAAEPSHFRVVPGCIVPTFPYGYHPPPEGLPFAHLMDKS